MKKNNSLRWRAEVLIFPLAITLMLWVVFWIEHRFRIDFTQFGIYPRSVEGLRGILFSPFIHGSLKHIFNNTVPLFVLLMGLFYFYRHVRWKVLIFGFLLTGILTWTIGRPAFHIGASGIVYMLVAFIFFKGVFSGYYQLVAIALIVVFLYGGLWWYIFPIDPKISWEGHLSGFIVGFIFALITKNVPLSQSKYEWEREDFDDSKDAFIRHFDEQGNFKEIPPQEELEDDKRQSTEGNPGIKINYIYTERNKDESKDQ